MHHWIDLTGARCHGHPLLVAKSQQCRSGALLGGAGATTFCPLLCRRTDDAPVDAMYREIQRGGRLGCGVGMMTAQPVGATRGRNRAVEREAHCVEQCRLAGTGWT